MLLEKNVGIFLKYHITSVACFLYFLDSKLYTVSLKLLLKFGTSFLDSERLISLKLDRDFSEII